MLLFGHILSSLPITAVRVADAIRMRSSVDHAPSFHRIVPTYFIVVHLLLHVFKSVMVTFGIPQTASRLAHIGTESPCSKYTPEDVHVW